MDIEIYKAEKSNRTSSKLSKYITKILISIILVFSSLIYVKSNEKNLNIYKKYVFSNSFSFGKANKSLLKYINFFPITTKETTKTVFEVNNQLEAEIERDDNGTKLNYGKNTVIKSLTSGIVVYIGTKDNLGPTVIIQGIDGYDIWYSNINNSNITIYDYLEKGSIIGESSELLLTISKDGKYIEYEEYIKQD